MRANWKSALLAVMGIASLAVAVPMSIANAQDAGQRGGQGGGFATQGGPGALGAPQRGRGMDMMQRMGGGGGTAMTQDQNFLYVVQGNQVFKLNKRDLSVVAAGRLPGGGPGGPGGGASFGGSGGRRGGASGGGDFGGPGGRRGGGGVSGGDIPPMDLPGDPIPPID